MPKNIINPIPYSKGSNPSLWLNLYERTCNDDLKLMYVTNCFSKSLQKWALDKLEGSWEDFKIIFIKCFSVKVTLEQTLKQLTNITMGEKGRAQHYIDRFKALKTDYEREKLRRSRLFVFNRSSL